MGECAEEPARALEAIVVWRRRQQRVDLGERLAKISSAVVEGEEQPVRLGGFLGSRVGPDDSMQGPLTLVDVVERSRNGPAVEDWRGAVKRVLQREPPMSFVQCLHIRHRRGCSQAW